MLGSGDVETAVGDEPVDGGDEPSRSGRLEPRERLVLGILVVVAALLSIPRLGVRSLWLDEAYTVGISNELFDAMQHTAGNQALYYLLVWPVTRLSIDPFWLRLPSAVLGLAGLVVVYRVGRRIGGPRLAGLTAGGLALSWGLARYSVEARSYTLAMLLVSVTWLAVIAAVQADDEDERRRWWWIFSVVTILVPFAHGLATLNLVAQLAALAVLPGDEGRRHLRRALRVVPIVAVELAVLFALGASEVGDWVPPLSIGQVIGVKQLMVGWGITGLVLFPLVAAAVVLVVREFLAERDRDAWVRLVPVFWAVGPPVMLLVLSFFRPYMSGRYVFASLPAFCLLGAGLIDRLGSMRRIVPAVALVAAFLLLDHGHVTTSSIEDWEEVTACISANAEPGDRLVTGAAHRSALDYYWSDHPELAQVEPLSPTEPFGEPRRLYDSQIDDHQDLAAVLLDDPSSSIWLIERGPPGRIGLVGVAFNRRITARYDLTETWYFQGELSMLRLDPIGADRPDSRARCDTVETPADMKPKS